MEKHRKQIGLGLLALSVFFLTMMILSSSARASGFSEPRIDPEPQCWTYFLGIWKVPCGGIYEERTKSDERSHEREREEPREEEPREEVCE